MSILPTAWCTGEYGNRTHVLLSACTYISTGSKHAYKQAAPNSLYSNTEPAMAAGS